MRNDLPSRDPIGKELRRARAQRRVGHGSKCASCGESRPEALIAGSSPMICAECKRKQKGQSIVDRHHVAGRNNHNLTVPVRVNDHRAIFGPAQCDWRKETLENPTGSPLLAASACIRGFCDFVIYLINELLLWIADLLEDFHKELVHRFGDHYWQVLNIGSKARRR